MSAGNRSQSLFLVSLMILASWVPFAAATDGDSDQSSTFEGGLFYDLDDFDPMVNGKPYLFAGGEDELIFSATRHLKQQWADDGYPGLVMPFEETSTSARTSGRACENAWTAGQTGTVQTTGGQIQISAMHVTANSAILIENGQSVSSTTLNNIGSTWETTIYPTNTNYFGNAPDVDNNCQIEIVIYAIDGGANIGGYFMPSMSATREIIYVDIDDLSWRNTILAHEFEHLLHNARDPFEYIWVDEGNADMAAFLCFGASNTIIGHANQWTQNASASVRWWNQRLADYGAGFMFMLFLADNLGGGSAIRQLVTDTLTGGQGIVDLAQTLGPGATPIGTTMSDIFANFTASVTLDHGTQAEFGLDNIDMYETCGSNQFCRLQLSGSNLNWGSMWQSGPHDLEGWGVHAFRFLDGTGSPLNLMIQPSELGFAGTILTHDAAAGTWSMERLRFDPLTGIGTALVPSFGNITDDVYLIVWYESGVDDCDYTSPNCAFPGGTEYPIASFDVMAGLITQPAEITVSQEFTTDRDEDGDVDTVEATIDVTSSAFYEVLDIEVKAYDNNTLHDTMEFSLEAGNSIPVNQTIWYTPPWDGDWTLHFTMKNQIGEIVDEALTLPLTLANMAPVAVGSAAANATQTWLPLQFFGAGYDLWGLGMDNESFSHNETPVGYNWNFGDGLSGSGLKDPTRSWQNPGMYNVTLTVVDQGGGVSDIQTWEISVNDTEPPTPRIDVGSPPVAISDPYTLLTSQRVQFSAARSEDNVPLNQLTFTWDFGDGTILSGQGLYDVSHEWATGSANGTAYNLTLSIDDGTHTANMSVTILIMNRVPRQVWFDDLQTSTLTPLNLPTMFTDDDGTIVATEWWFDENVNFDGGIVTMSSPFLNNHSTDANPLPAWKTPGWKNIQIYATDDAGNVSWAVLQVEVLNQRPVAIFPRPDDGSTDSMYTFLSSSFDPDGNSGNMSHNWTITGIEEHITNNQVNHMFTEPGVYTVTLVVTDERGMDSLPKSYTIHIANPLPMPVLSAHEAWLNGTVVTVPGSDLSVYNWRRTFTDSGDIFVAPGTVLRFSSDGSRDMDSAFEGMFNPDQGATDWNGIVDTTWDWGDASPPSHENDAWHIFEQPGYYTVTLTVRDGYGTGDSNSTSIGIWVSSAPFIYSDHVIGDGTAFSGYLNIIEAYATDVDMEAGMVAWRDDDATTDSDNDGTPDNDQDTPLNTLLTYWWDLDDSVDEDGNGNFNDDWSTNPNVREGRGNDAQWNESGEYVIRLKVCDDTGVCTIETYEVIVRDPDASSDALGDLSWKDLLPSTDSGSLYIIILIALVLTLGWLVMREPEEIEVEAEHAASTYDVTEVHTEGGILGMDQHAPPPKPTHLTKEDRRSKDSGYVRPVTSRRRR
ncbi:MAG: PKD domain-containing protein [Candidatus Thalassarchaeaceae archaeon]|jgi:PKD repeat protein|nr:PKD domain-containing protein [Candidatus Thalassarchaeaceae archaeon]MDP6844060.1 PKD domain-containing protein [Candidatus Thalassarchaeaceae archaeon]